MNNNSSTMTCAIVCWGIAALFGCIVAAVLMSIGPWTFLQAAFMGVIAFVGLGLVLALTICRPLPHLSEVRAMGASTTSPEPTTTSMASTSAHATAAAAMDTVAATAVETAPKATPKPTPKAAPKPTPKAEPAPATGAARKPATYEAARDGKADDLKRIKGIGPKLEQLCNSMGFYHFDQIAAWSADEIAWVDDNLEGFKGRVTRDTWVEQAKLLASGAETEFSKKVDKGNVY